MTLIHGKSGKEANPLGHTCNHVIAGVVCGQVFETPWFLTRHKKETGHFVAREKKNVQAGN